MDENLVRKLIELSKLINETILDVNLMFDNRLLCLKTKLTNEEYLQREEELSYLRRKVNEIFEEML